MLPPVGWLQSLAELMSCLPKTNPADSAIAGFEPDTSASEFKFWAFCSTAVFASCRKCAVNTDKCHRLPHQAQSRSIDSGPSSDFLWNGWKMFMRQRRPKSKRFLSQQNHNYIYILQKKKNNHLGHRSNDLGWQWQSKKRKNNRELFWLWKDPICTFFN